MIGTPAIRNLIREGKIANYHPYPPTCWNASPRDHFGTPGPYEDAVQGTPLFEESTGDDFKGIDVMRTVRSFDPCLPCGVHMYLGNGKTIETVPREGATEASLAKAMVGRELTDRFPPRHATIGDVIVVSVERTLRTVFAVGLNKTA